MSRPSGRISGILWVMRSKLATVRSRRSGRNGGSGPHGNSPFGQVLAVLVEDLDAVVVAIVDEYRRVWTSTATPHVVHIPGPRLLAGSPGLPVSRNLPFMNWRRACRYIRRPRRRSRRQPRDEGRPVEMQPSAPGTLGFRSSAAAACRPGKYVDRMGVSSTIRRASAHRTD